MKPSAPLLLMGGLSSSILQVFALTDCGYPAYSKQDSFATANASTYIGCSTACFQYSQCKSFAFDPSSGDCQLYDLPVEGNIDIWYLSTYFFYDTACETSPSCGWRGNDVRFRAFSYSNDGTEANCINNCTSLTNCKSYAYGNGECFLYDVPVNGNYEQESDSPYIFNDRSCIKTSNQTKTTTAKSTTTTSTTAPTTASTSKASTTATTSGQTTISAKSSTTTITSNQTTLTTRTSTTSSVGNQGTSTTKPTTTTTSSVTQSTSTIKSSTTTSVSSQSTSVTTKQSTSTSNTSISTTTKQNSTTTTKQATTTITISSQPYFCTAMY